MSEAGGPAAADGFLAGRVRVFQPADGRHRAGLDAVLLGAAVPADAAGRLADLGAGAGVAGLVAASRCPGLSVSLVEIDPVAAGCARRSVALDPALASGRARVVEADVTASAATLAAAGLPADGFDHVILNPPFHPAGRHRPSPDAARAAAHRAGPGLLDAWLRTAARLLRPSGRVTVVYRADETPELLAALGRRFGGLALLPVHPRADAPATRVVAVGRPQSRAPFALRPPLVLHEASGDWTAEADAILRDGAPLPI
jgi:tRNA1(Val) A37 N6-methylase TrmN6